MSHTCAVSLNDALGLPPSGQPGVVVLQLVGKPVATGSRDHSPAFETGLGYIEVSRRWHDKNKEVGLTADLGG